MDEEEAGKSRKRPGRIHDPRSTASERPAGGWRKKLQGDTRAAFAAADNRSALFCGQQSIIEGRVEEQGEEPKSFMGTQADARRIK